MKRAPAPRPEWIRTCSIDHESGNVIDFPVIEDVASLLWVINLGCIDLTSGTRRATTSIVRTTCTSISIPARARRGISVLECGRIVRDALDTLKMPSVVKTTGSKGLHVYVPIVRGPGAERGVDVRQGACRRAGGAASGADDGRVQSGEAAARSRARRLQPERLGPHAGVRLLGAAAAARARLDAGHLGGDRRAACASRTSAWTTSARGSRRPAISGSRCCKKPNGSISGGISSSQA